MNINWQKVDSNIWALFRIGYYIMYHNDGTDITTSVIITSVPSENDVCCTLVGDHTAQYLDIILNEKYTETQKMDKCLKYFNGKLAKERVAVCDMINPKTEAIN